MVLQAFSRCALRSASRSSVRRIERPGRRLRSARHPVNGIKITQRVAAARAAPRDASAASEIKLGFSGPRRQPAPSFYDGHRPDTILRRTMTRVLLVEDD